MLATLPPPVTSRDDTSAEVNPHYLDRVVEAARTHEFEASEDIVAGNGMKLLAKGARIDAGVRDRLLQHKLRKPLEESMRVADGVTPERFAQEAESLLDEQPLLRALYRSDPSGQGAGGALGPSTIKTLRSLRLGSTLQSLLTVYTEHQPDKLRHAVSVAMLAAGLSRRLDPAHPDQAQALLTAGLCHDVGELYIDPAYLEKGVRLPPEQWKHIAAHPIVAHRLIKDLPEVGPVAAQAVLHHHERQDGFGYPFGLQGAQIALPSQMLGVAERLTGMLEGRIAPLRRADVAVKLVPDEFSRPLLDLVAALCHDAADGEERMPPLPPIDATLARIAHVTALVQRAVDVETALAEEIAHTSPAFKSLLAQSKHRFERIHRALSSTGLDTPAQRDLLGLDHLADERIHLEISFILKEISWRLSELEREILLRIPRLAPADIPVARRMLEWMTTGQAIGVPIAA